MTLWTYSCAAAFTDGLHHFLIGIYINTAVGIDILLIAVRAARKKVNNRFTFYMAWTGANVVLVDGLHITNIMNL